MKSIEGVWEHEECEDIKVTINYDYTVSGEIQVIDGRNSVLIPGKMVEQFISAFLKDRQIVEVNFKPKGFIKS